jgi:peptidoglycan/LPS O-acetylase OafA/YrhL
VDLFFVISGFIIAHNAAQRPVGWRDFAYNRLMRVAPLY